VATSPTFLQGLATQARATVEYTTPSSVAAIEAGLAGPKIQGCAVAAFTVDAKHSAPQGATPGPSTLSPLTVPPLGLREFPFRVNVTMDLQSLQVPIFQDFLVIFNGDTLIRAFFLNPGSGFRQDLEQSLLRATVARAGT
jgi:hypothetical protein